MIQCLLLRSGSLGQAGRIIETNVNNGSLIGKNRAILIGVTAHGNYIIESYSR